MLPATLAIFDDMMVIRDDPKVLHRYCLVRVQNTGGPYIMSAIRAQEAPVGLIDGEFEMYPGRYSLILYPGTICYDSKIWKTGKNVIVEGEEIPIVDFEYRTLFRSFPYDVRAEGDTVDWCRERQVGQSRMRLQILTAPLQAKPAPAPRPEPVLQIPAFVAEMVKGRAIASGDFCPISQVPFEKDVPATLLGCFHLYDPESIQAWMKIKKACPMCKAEIGAMMII